MHPKEWWEDQWFNEQLGEDVDTWSGRMYKYSGVAGVRPVKVLPIW
jgi:hypothetical protein